MYRKIKKLNITGSKIVPASVHKNRKLINSTTIPVIIVSISLYPLLFE